MAAKSGEYWYFSPLHRILLLYPVGNKFAQNRSMSYGFRDIYNFLFSAKIQDGPLCTWCSCSTLPVKNLLKITLSLTVSGTFTIFYFPQKFKMAAKSCQNGNFSLLLRILLYCSMGQKFAQNRSISYGFRDIYNFLFSNKLQDGRQKWRKLKFFFFVQDTIELPYGSKINSKSFYLFQFSRYLQFFIFC